jgi:mono/diheme cytochrome c family protein
MIKWVLFMGLVMGLAAAVSGAERRSIPWEKNHLQIGRALYRENCVVCHDIDRAQSKKAGPSFYQLFKRDKMPLANMKVNRDYIKVRVKFGGALMPAFRQRLSEAEINTLIDYVASQ